MSNPLITVIIRTYNRAELLPRAVRCVLEQTMGDFELLIVDDGSTDATPDVLKTLTRADSRIIPVRRMTNSRDFSPREEPMNDGLAIARGSLIAYLDDDYLWRPRFLSLMSEQFEKNPAVQFVYCDTADHTTPTELAAMLVQDERTISFRNQTSVIFPHRGDFQSIEFFPSGNGYRDFVDTNEMMHTRRALDAVGGRWRHEHPRWREIQLIQGERFAYRSYEDLDFVERVVASVGLNATRYLPVVLVDWLDQLHPLYANPQADVTADHRLFVRETNHALTAPVRA